MLSSVGLLLGVREWLRCSIVRYGVVGVSNILSSSLSVCCLVGGCGV